MYKSGALCYRDCGKIGLVNCGIGMCASSSDNCISGLINMIVDFVVSFIQFVGFIATFGADSGAATGLDALKAGIKSAFSKVKSGIQEGAKTLYRIATSSAARSEFLDTVKDKAIDLAKDLITDKIKDDAVSYICGQVGDSILAGATPTPPDFNVDMIDVLGVGAIVDDCADTSDSNGQLMCAKSIMNTISTVDPTGLAGMASAFMEPTCDV